MQPFSQFIIVDNEVWRRGLLREMLLGLGYKGENITISEQSRIAREVARIQGPCCVFITDDKLGFARDLKASQRVNRLSVVVIISEPTSAKVTSALEAGVDGVLRQPCSAADMETLLQNLRLSA